MQINPYYTDPTFMETQKYLNNLGQNVISGELPDYYKPVGEIGGEQLNSLVSKVNRDVSKQVQSNMAKRGMVNSGIADYVTAKSVADKSAQLRYKDLQDALTRRMKLFDFGSNMVSTVGGRGLNYANAMNSYSLSKAIAEEQARQAEQQFQYIRRHNRHQAKNALWSSLGELGGDLLGGIATGGLGGISDMFGNLFGSSSQTNGLNEVDFANLFGSSSQPESIGNFTDFFSF